MKKSILLFIAVGLLVASCEKEKPKPRPSNNGPTGHRIQVVDRETQEPLEGVKFIFTTGGWFSSSHTLISNENGYIWPGDFYYTDLVLEKNGYLTDKYDTVNAHMEMQAAVHLHIHVKDVLPSTSSFALNYRPLYEDSWLYNESFGSGFDDVIVRDADPGTGYIIAIYSSHYENIYFTGSGGQDVYLNCFY